jgi:hypothetical protein
MQGNMSIAEQKNLTIYNIDVIFVRAVLKFYPKEHDHGNNNGRSSVKRN